MANVSIGGLLAPGGLATSNITATSITVSWAAVTGAANYTLEWSTSSTGPWTALAAQTTRTFNHTGRTSSTTYHYRVRANATGGATSPYAGPVSVIGRGHVCISVTVPFLECRLQLDKKKNKS